MSLNIPVSLLRICGPVTTTIDLSQLSGAMRKMLQTYTSTRIVMGGRGSMGCMLASNILNDRELGYIIVEPGQRIIGVQLTANDWTALAPQLEMFLVYARLDEDMAKQIEGSKHWWEYRRETEAPVNFLSSSRGALAADKDVAGTIERLVRERPAEFRVRLAPDRSSWRAMLSGLPPTDFVLDDNAVVTVQLDTPDDHK